MNEGKKTIFEARSLIAALTVLEHTEIHLLGLKVCAPMPGLKNKTKQFFIYHVTGDFRGGG